MTAVAEEAQRRFRAEIDPALAEVFAQGQIRTAELKQVRIAGRALVYGFARMNTDGHFPRWGVAGGEVERVAEAVIDLSSRGLRKPRPSW
jgi:hypothetical protein